ncbi:sigma-54-dependent Fis family transcriptional regulator [Maledivibacter halophilus]|uniref:PAS domain S-box-containing protein n=1 Tax=Maledivibacter halophilus TaxID=36842 RepID=A0A1T5JJT4_9FIRM|nr:sigma 54-interacting transcriptional regulator [Maledivibacter halophilus]SKC51665.1 PAS domain S-box-containing protein [Maledivibacter halophilus]
MEMLSQIKDKDYIIRSHERCKNIGIKKDMVYSKKIISGSELQKKLELRRELSITAEPFINQLYNFVKGSNFFSMLTDEEGCILSVIGDEDILSEAFSFKMVPGAYMNEENIGTNAMGTSIAEKRAVQISGKEHFIKAYHRWTCSGAPIRDPEGKIIGSLDLTGYSENVHSHTLGMVVAAVNAIEKMLCIKKCNEELKMSKIYTETIIDSIPAGILTVDLDGNIKSINNYIMKMFGFSRVEMKRMKIWNLFDGWERVKEALYTKNLFLDEDVFINSRRNKLQFNLSAYPLYDNKQSLRNIILTFKEVKKVRKLANRIMGRRAIYTFDKIIGENKEFLETIEYAKKIADSKSTILIMGESGTGKEIFAQSIHNHSGRREEPFIALNCGAIPKNLIESELFGYEEGAFTGAKSGGHPGKFEIADGGTIFLDEIGEMPLDMQTRLLRVIEESTVNRIGSADEILVDVRIIAATNKDLTDEVAKGNFRKDLYYRLNVLPLRLSPLRQRKEDIPLLIEYFMNRISKRLNKKKVDISKEHMKKLMQYEWRGNVRELENFIELIINTEYIPIGRNRKEIEVDIKNNINKTDDECYKLEHVEKEHIKRILNICEGNITLAAKKLGIGRNTLYRKLRKYNIDSSIFEQCNETEQQYDRKIAP